eukprot:SAG11_NODE_12624_length_694_cov_0.929412_1_plen_148_part_01
MEHVHLEPAELLQHVRRYFELVGKHIGIQGGDGDEPASEGAHSIVSGTSIAFEVSGEGGGCWLLRSNDGVHSLSMPEAAPTDCSCTVRTDSVTMAAIAGGSLTPFSALLRGKVSVLGAKRAFREFGRPMQAAAAELKAELRRGQPAGR